MKIFQQIILCIFVFQLTLSACKFKKEESTAGVSSDDFEKLETLTFKLTASAEGETKEFGLKKTEDYAGASPLATVDYSYFRAAEDHQSVVLDVLSNGKLIDISTGRSLPESCITVALYEKFSGAGVTSFAFLSNLTPQWTSIESLGPEWLQFEYCEEARDLHFNFKIGDDAGRFREALNARGLALLDPASLMLSVGSSRLVASLFDTARSTDAPRRLPEPVRPESLPAPHTPKAPDAEHPVHPTRSDSAGSAARASDAMSGAPTLRGAGSAPLGAGAPAFRSMADFESLPFVDRIARNQQELDFFQRLKSEGKVTEGSELGRGSYATVKEVTIDGQSYVIREESIISRREPGRKEMSFEDAQDMRLKFLIQNEFAKLNPGAGFVRTHLSFVDTTTGKFITISEIRRGGETEKAFRSPAVGSETRRVLTENLLDQLEIYQKGFPITIQGRAYHLYFSHGDIKPTNAIMDASGTRASFIDFGFSRVILKSEAGEFMELRASIDPATGVPREEIVPLVFGEQVGSPFFLSPEIINMSPGGYRGEAAYRALMDSDTHAMNVTSFYARNGALPFQAKNMPALVLQLQKVKSRGVGNPRKLLKFDESADVRAIRSASLGWERSKVISENQGAALHDPS